MPRPACPAGRAAAAQVRQLSNPRAIYCQLMDMLSRLAGLGLVHCDYNEFNILVSRPSFQPICRYFQLIIAAV